MFSYMFLSVRISLDVERLEKNKIKKNKEIYQREFLTLDGTTILHRY